MAEIGDLIFSLLGKPNPRDALMEAVTGGGGAAAQPPSPQAGGGAQPPVGTGGAPVGPPTTPGTRPGEIRRGADGQNYQYAETTGMEGHSGPQGWIPTTQEPGVYKSPDELLNLYMEFQDRQSKNASINRGLGLMFASAAHPENRAGMINSMTRGSGGGSGGGGNDMISSIMEFQKNNAALSQKAAQRASVPAIASQYGLDPTTAMFLFDSGNLDSVIGELSKGKKQIVKGADGRDRIVDLMNGAVGEPIGPDAPPEVELVEGVNGSLIAVDKKTKLPITDREPVRPAEGNTEFERNFQNALRERPELTRDVFRAETNRTTQQDYTDVNGRMVGKPPTDTAWDVDENGAVRIDERNAPIAIPIKGGSADLAATKAQTEADEAAKGEDQRRANQAVTALTIGDEVDRVLKSVEENKDSYINAPTGPLSMVTQYNPWSPAYQVKNLLETVKGNAGFTKLQQMRDSSPTGAALGPVSDFENKLLQATAGNLEQAQKTEDVVYNLKRIKKQFHYMAFNKVDTPEKAEKMWSDIKSEIQTEAAEDSSIDSLLEKYK